MTDDILSSLPRTLQAIQTELTAVRRNQEEHALATNRSIGNLAQSILQLRTDSNTVMLAVNGNSARMASLENRVTRIFRSGH